MTNVVLSLPARKARYIAAFPATITPKTQPNQANIERQQAIENALSAALYFIRLPHTESGLKAATGRAIRAASMLKQACAESTTSGRA